MGFAFSPKHVTRRAVAFTKLPYCEHLRESGSKSRKQAAPCTNSKTWGSLDLWGRLDNLKVTARFVQHGPLNFLVCGWNQSCVHANESC